MVRLKPSGELDSKFEDRASAMWFYTDHFLDSRDRIVAGGIAGEIGVAVARVFNP
jgi:hypothetical protein